MSEARVLVSAVLLAAGVAAAVAAGVTRIANDRGPHIANDRGPHIASVRLAELTAEHAERAARAGAPAHGIRESTRVWAVALEQALGDVAERRRVVLLPSRAVAAGAPDVTDLVRLMVEDRLRDAGSPARVSPAPVSPARVSGGEARP